MMFGLEARYKRLIDSFIINYPYSFYVYGSRAKNTEKITSDLDFCIFSDIPLTVLAEIKEGLNNLMLPFTVDVVAWYRLSTEFKSLIKNDLVAYCPDPFFGASVIELSGGYTTSTEKKTTLLLPDGKNKDAIDLRSLYAPASLLLVTKNTGDAFIVTHEMITEHEARFGPIAQQSWFLMMPYDEKIDYYQPLTMTSDAVDYLIQKKILGLGINKLFSKNADTLFSRYKKILEAGMYVIEDLKYYSYAGSNHGFLHVIPFATIDHRICPARALFVRPYL
jgi:kynurenine formamidase